MSMKKITSLFLALSFVIGSGVMLSSCVKQEVPTPQQEEQQEEQKDDQSGEDDEIFVPFSTNVGDYESDDQTGGDTKSSIGSDSQLTKFDSDQKNMTLFQFVQEGNIYRLYRSYYFASLSDLTITGKLGSTYKFFGVENMGDQRLALTGVNGTETGTWTKYADNVNFTESNIENFKYSISKFSDITLNSGMPLVSEPFVMTLSSSSKFSLTFRRLMSRYDISVVKNMQHGTFNVTALKLCNAPKSVYPFHWDKSFPSKYTGAGSKVTSTSEIIDGDTNGNNDLEWLNSNGSYAAKFYLFENYQGVLLPSNTDPAQKTPESLNAKQSGLAGLCSYIEMTGTYRDASGGLVSNNTYKIYLGNDNVKDFSVIRDRVVKITITLSDKSGFLSSTWKVAPSVTDNRTLNFAQSSYTLPYESKTYVSLICNPGTLADYGLTYTLSQNLVNAGVTFDSNAMELCQSQKLSNDVTGTLTATSWDGRKTATTTVVAKKPAGEVIIVIEPECDDTTAEKEGATDNNIVMTSPQANSVGIRVVRRSEGQADVDLTSDAVINSVTSENTDYITVGTALMNNKYPLTGKKATPAATKAAISGPVHIRATATYQGQTIQSKDSEANAISVTDNRDVEWGSKTATIYNDGVSKSTSLTANFTGKVTINPGNVSGFSWSENNSTWNTGSKEISVSKKVAKTIYYKYTGSEETTIKFGAAVSNIKSTFLEIESETLHIIGIHYYHSDYWDGPYNNGEIEYEGDESLFFSVSKGSSIQKPAQFRLIKANELNSYTSLPFITALKYSITGGGRQSEWYLDEQFTESEIKFVYAAIQVIDSQGILSNIIDINKVEFIEGEKSSFKPFEANFEKKTMTLTSNGISSSVKINITPSYLGYETKPGSTFTVTADSNVNGFFFGKNDNPTNCSPLTFNATQDMSPVTIYVKYTGNTDSNVTLTVRTSDGMTSKLYIDLKKVVLPPYETKIWHYYYVDVDDTDGFHTFITTYEQLCVKVTEGGSTYKVYFKIDGYQNNQFKNMWSTATDGEVMEKWTKYDLRDKSITIRFNNGSEGTYRIEDLAWEEADRDL